jgi:hypothetical protein
MITKLMFRLSVGVGIVALLAAFTALILGVSSWGEVKAQGTSECTLNTLYGTYLFQAQGVISDAGELRPYVEAGTWTLDGNGNAEGLISISIDGAPLARGEVFTATYEHHSACVFTVRDAFGLELELYTTPSATTMTYFSPGFSGTQIKQ